MTYERELQAALEAAGRAGKMLRQAYADFQVIPDARADISTEADRESQEIILRHLHQVFPGDALCAEEQTETLTRVAQTGPRLWIVDPIDGTRGFAKKTGEFSVMIAFLKDNKVKVGVVLEPAPWAHASAPASPRLTYAVHGGGCWRQDAEKSPTSCQVTTNADPERLTLTQTHSRNPQTPSRPAQLLQPLRIVETYSAGIKLALVARGEVDAYVNFYPNFHDWDIAAGHLLVEEAGGTVTGMTGKPILYGKAGANQRQGLLASNGVLHEVALRKLNGEQGGATP
jgi:3'(2'), 5'-bisphosphate nucleotidase